MLESFFKLREHGTNVRTELIAGLTTFLTMAYIIFVNPSILGDAGMPKGAVFVATCVIAALGTLIMGLYANYPIAMAPGMGLNAYFAYVVVLGMGYTWQVALGAVFISGCLFLIVTVTGLRELFIQGIPQSLRTAITVGIGMDLTTLGGELVCQKDSFLCAARGVSIGIAFQKKIGVGLFGGEGFIMRRRDLRNHVRVLEEAPDIDHGLAGEIEVAVGRVRRT